MKCEKLVTIGITTYNSNLNFFKRALSSVVNQSYHKLEIIICDDGSNNVNEIEKIVNQLNDKRIIFIKSNLNKGVSNSLNTIIDKAKGHYFNWCPDDDFMHKDKIKLQLESLTNDKQFSFCDHQYQILNYKKEIIHKKFLNFFKEDEYIFFLDRIHGAAFLIPVFFLKKNQFNINLKHIQDYDLWIRLFENLESKYLNKTLFYAQGHTGQYSHKYKNEANIEKTKFYIDFIKKNFLTKIYYKSINFFFLTIVFFKYRDLKQVVDFFGKDNNKKDPLQKILIQNYFFQSQKLYELTYLTAVFFGLLLRKVFNLAKPAINYIFK